MAKARRIGRRPVVRTRPSQTQYTTRLTSIEEAREQEGETIPLPGHPFKARALVLPPPRVADHRDHPMLRGEEVSFIPNEFFTIIQKCINPAQFKIMMFMMGNQHNPLGRSLEFSETEIHQGVGILADKRGDSEPELHPLLEELVRIGVLWKMGENYIVVDFVDYGYRAAAARAAARRDAALGPRRIAPGILPPVVVSPS